jgi:hypothetical protein
MSEDTPNEPTDPEDATPAKNAGEHEKVVPFPPEANSGTSASPPAGKGRSKGRSSTGEGEQNKRKGGSREKKVIRPNIPMPDTWLAEIAAAFRLSAMRGSSVRDMIATALEQMTKKDIIDIIRKVSNQSLPPASDDLNK